MGSGQSSVKGIRIEQSDKAQEDQSNVTKKKQNGTDVSLIDKKDTLPSSKGTSADTPDKDEEIVSLTKQLCESESQRLDLEDRVQALEERIEYLDNQTLMTETKPCDETLHVKDQYIVKLEKEKADNEKESNKMKQKLRRKIKQLNSQMAEFKQESHFEMMELRDEMQKLVKENQKLKGSTEDSPQRQSSAVENAPKLPGGEKMKLILELSEQVTEQGDKINKLEKKVKDRDQIIDELRVRLKNNTEYMKAVDQSGLSDRGDRNNSARGDRNNSARGDRNNSARGDRNNSARGVKANELSARQHWGSSSPHHSGYTSSSANTDKKQTAGFGQRSGQSSTVKSQTSVDSLFAVQQDSLDDEDEDFDHSARMKKLSDLLLGTKADASKARESLESLNSDRNEPATQLYQIVEEAAGATGRDSGLGSAGKRENENTDGDAMINSYKNWKESSTLSFESEMSDGDSVTDLRLQSKIASAPPKLQGNAARTKKKSHSLRKRASEKDDDRPPRPSMAFMNSNQNGIVSEDRIANLNKLPHVLSPVNVS